MALVSRASSHISSRAACTSWGRALPVISPVRLAGKVESTRVWPASYTHLNLSRRLLGGVNGATATANQAAESKIPKPVVKIDNMSDPFATVVSVEFGDRLGELLDTIAALKNLGLNIRRAKIDQSATQKNRNTFYITDALTSEKILKSARLEEIRMTIISNMLQYHPESAENLAAGQSTSVFPQRDATNPLGLKMRSVVPTTIEVVEHEGGSCSVLKLITRDRPGLLVDIVSVLKDINVNVVSAEIDTEGIEVKDQFFITYHGEPLNAPMVQLVTNALQYYLSLAEVEKEESY